MMDCGLHKYDVIRRSAADSRNHIGRFSPRAGRAERSAFSYQLDVFPTMAARSRDGSFRAAREASGDDERYCVTSPLPAGRGSEYLLMGQRPQKWPHKNSVKTAEFYLFVVQCLSFLGTVGWQSCRAAVEGFRSDPKRTCPPAIKMGRIKVTPRFYRTPEENASVEDRQTNCAVLQRMRRSMIGWDTTETRVAGDHGVLRCGKRMQLRVSVVTKETPPTRSAALRSDPPEEPCARGGSSPTPQQPAGAVRRPQTPRCL